MNKQTKFSTLVAALAAVTSLFIASFSFSFGSVPLISAPKSNCARPDGLSVSYLTSDGGDFMVEQAHLKAGASCADDLVDVETRKAGALLSNFQICLYSHNFDEFFLKSPSPISRYGCIALSLVYKGKTYTSEKVRLRSVNGRVTSFTPNSILLDLRSR